MASIEEQLRNARTLEDIVNLLTILFTNLNNQNEQYYDMFLNPIPMDLDLERYDENGELVTVVHPNVAKMRISTYSGEGDPNGRVVAGIGALYVDLQEPNSLYYKATGSDANGWIGIWSTNNLNYLTPDGDGSELTDLNMDSASSGTLKVQFGGTGTKSLTGLVKGNGTAPFTPATDGVDYIGPNCFTGMITYFPFDITTVENSGWLVCNGGRYVAAQYPNLYARIGNKYKITAGMLSGTFYAYKNGDTVVYVNTSTVTTSTKVYESVGAPSLLVITATATNSITLSDGNTYTYDSTANVNGATYADVDSDGVVTFRVPNLIDKYVKGGIPEYVGTTGAGHVAAHTHTLSGSTGQSGEHTHSRGGMNITGYMCGTEKVFKNPSSNPPSKWGAFSQWKANVVSGYSDNNKFDNNIWKFNAADSWTGNTSKAQGWNSTKNAWDSSLTTHSHSLSGSTGSAGSGTNEVDHIVMVPVIKY